MHAIGSCRACEQSLSRLIGRRGGEEGKEKVAQENLEFSSLCLQAGGGEHKIVVSRCYSCAWLTGLQIVATKKRCIYPTGGCMGVFH